MMMVMHSPKHTRKCPGYHADFNTISYSSELSMEVSPGEAAQFPGHNEVNGYPLIRSSG